jgi:hypothetical protein
MEEDAVEWAQAREPVRKEKQGKEMLDKQVVQKNS